MKRELLSLLVKVLHLYISSIFNSPLKNYSQQSLTCRSNVSEMSNIQIKA